MDDNVKTVTISGAGCLVVLFAIAVDIGLLIGVVIAVAKAVA